MTDTANTDAGDLAETTDGDTATSTGTTDGDAASATESAQEPVPAELVWAADLTMLSRPTVADGVAVFYHQEETGDDLTLSAYDLATGKEQWSFQATPADSHSIEAPSIVEADGRDVVVTATPAPDAMGLLVALDLTDGTEVASAGDETHFADFPTACWPDDTATCVTVWDDEAREWVESEAAVDGKSIVITEVDDEPSEAEAAATREDEEEPSYFDTRVDDDGGWFTFHRNGKLAWEVPLKEVGMEAGADDQVFGAYRPDEDVITSSLNWHPDTGTAVDVTDQSTVGFDTETGEVLWQREGALLCGSRAEDVVVLCEGDGQIRLDPGTGGVYDGPDGEMIGVDVTTGEEVWSRPISGQDWGDLEGMPSPFQGETVMLVGAEDPEVVEMLTGESAETRAEDMTFSCFTAASWTHALPLDRDSPATGDRQTEFLEYGCEADRTPAQIESWPARIDSYGVEADGLRLIARPDRLEAYRLPE